MLILTQTRGAIYDSDNFKDYGVTKDDEVVAINKTDQQIVKLGRYCNNDSARRCLTKLFTALSTGKKEFKMPYSQWRKPKV